jgi:hypothetical protein
VTNALVAQAVAEALVQANPHAQVGQAIAEVLMRAAGAPPAPFSRRPRMLSEAHVFPVAVLARRRLAGGARTRAFVVVMA